MQTQRPAKKLSPGCVIPCLISCPLLSRILKMDPAKKFKAMLTMQMSDVTALSISPDDGNQLAVLHLRYLKRDVID